MEVICLETEAFYALVDEVYERMLEKENAKNANKWMTKEEAIAFLNIGKTTLQNLRNEGLIKFSQPNKKTILYDRQSLDEYLENNAKNTF